MLSLPRFTRSLLDHLDDDDYLIYPLDYLVPQSSGKKKSTAGQLAVPTIKNNKFNLALDLHQFDPSDISVKFDENSLQISGKREKKSEDGTHYEYREYAQHFTVPENVLTDQLKCHLTEKGILQVEAPVQPPAIEEGKAGHKNIPIEFVNKQ